MKTLAGLIPLAVAIAAASAGIWWLLWNHGGIGKWALAAALIAHGAIHALFFSPVPPRDAGQTWPFNFSQSWLSGPLGADPVRALGTVCVVAVIVAFVISALATAGLVVPTDWWRPAVAAAAVLSALTLVLFFSPQLVLGLAIDGALLWLVVSAAWTPSMVTPV